MGRDADIRTSDRMLHNTLWLLDHCLGRRNVDRVLATMRTRVRERIAASLASKPGAEIRPVDRRRDLSPEEFCREYLDKGIPVVLEGAASEWSATRKWTPEWLAANYGGTPVRLINISVEDVASTEHRHEGEVTTLGKTIEDMLAGSRAYPRFLPLLHEHPELTRDFDLDWLASMRGRFHSRTLYQMFLGSAGTNTGLHSAMANNLFVQTHGRKRWLLFSPVYNPVFDPPLERSSYFLSRVDAEAPDLEAFPLFRYVDGYETEIEAGDILYNPPFYWHQVTNPTLSIGVGYRWLGWPSIARSSLTQTLLTLLATNPPVWKVTGNKADFTKTYVSAK